jgi:hypothetical protein
LVKTCYTRFAGFFVKGVFLKKNASLLIICAAIMFVQCDNYNLPIVPTLKDVIDEYSSIKEIKITKLPYPDTFVAGAELPVAWGQEGWEENGWENKYGLEVSGLNGGGKIRVLEPAEYTVGAIINKSGAQSIAVALNDTHRYADVRALFYVEVAPSVDGYHEVKISGGVEGGKLVPFPSSAAAGQTVTVLLHPDEGYGYKKDCISVTNPSTEIDFTHEANGAFTFLMPDSDVTLSARFFEAAAQIKIADQAATYCETLPEAFTEADGKNAVITLLRDASLDAGITVTSRITLTLADGAAKTINRGSGFASSLFTVDGGNARLVLDAGDSLGMVLDGGSDSGITANKPLVMVTSGELVMGERVTLKNNKNSTSIGTVGGGVHVGTSGKFMMAGGKISGSFSLTGGAVFSKGAFTMTDGEISGNTSAVGAVSVSAGEFIMEGGRISNNTAVSGGGVYITGDGKFTMKDGEISGNTASSSDSLGNGGGVYIIDDGKFTMENGVISGNTGNNGGGVYVFTSGKFSIENGVISGNIAKGNGGGVCSSGAFTMNGGEISGNAAGVDGGGVSVEGGSFVMSKGSIYGADANEKKNIAANKGAAFYKVGSLLLLPPLTTTTNDTITLP